MKRIRVGFAQGRMALLAAALAFLLAAGLVTGCLAQTASGELFVGTWDLVSGSNSDDDGSLSAENIELMKALGVDSYLVLQGDGACKLVTLDDAKSGTWRATGQTAGTAEIEGRTASITTSGTTLKLVQAGTTLVFEKGEPRAEDNVDRALGGGGARRAGRSPGSLSDSVVSGSLLEKPMGIVDDAICAIEVDGVGVDALGDAGLNLQVVNRRDAPIDVWVLDPFTANGISVDAYLYETVPARGTATAFLQLDGADLRAAGIAGLDVVSGTILVDDDNDIPLRAYPFDIGLQP